MRPTPQHLADVVDQFSDAELFVIVRDGVRFSAMPAWSATNDDSAIWSVVAFLRDLPDLDAATYLAQIAPPRQDTPAMPFGTTGPLVTIDMHNQSQPADEYLYAVPGTG